MCHTQEVSLEYANNLMHTIEFNLKSVDPHSKGILKHFKLYRVNGVRVDIQFQQSKPPALPIVPHSNDYQNSEFFLQPYYTLFTTEQGMAHDQVIYDPRTKIHAAGKCQSMYRPLKMPVTVYTGLNTNTKADIYHRKNPWIDSADVNVRLGNFYMPFANTDHGGITSSLQPMRQNFSVKITYYVSAMNILANQ